MPNHFPLPFPLPDPPSPKNEEILLWLLSRRLRASSGDFFCGVLAEWMTLSLISLNGELFEECWDGLSASGFFVG